jgi:hypothetical protein
MVRGPAEALLLETFGLPLLAYLCASDEKAMADRLDGSAALLPSAEAVLQRELTPLAEQVATSPGARPASPFELQQVLGSHHSETGTSVGNALRLAAGGQIAAPPETDDRVAEILLHLALDQYPVFLVEKTEPWPHIPISPFRHPLKAELDELLIADADLCRLFPSDDPGLGRRGFIYTSLGRGFSLESVLFGELVLGSAWDSAAVAAFIPSPQDVSSRLLKHLETVRTAARGEPTSVRALVAFTGVTTSEGTPLDLPWGVLRPLTPNERRIAPPSLEGAVSGTDSSGGTAEVSYAGELVLDTTLPYVLESPAEATHDSWPNLPGTDDLGRRIEAVQLAALIGIERNVQELVIAKPAWTWIDDPLAFGRNLGWSEIRSGPAFMPYALSGDDCKSVSLFSELIDRHRSQSIEIAIRRVISAAHARVEPVDRLVDAVIAWENLFGTSEGEPRLRITAAMAWLFDDEGASREALQRKLKLLYDTRSQIVHGGAIDQSRVSMQANDALGFALRALKLLFSEHPQLLALGDGAARSLRLILGGEAQLPQHE